jgi:hypothetical protein
MEKAFQKLLNKLLLKKYPIYLDVYVFKSGKYSPNQKICYEVFLIISNEYFETSLSRKQIDEVKEDINNLAKYMDIKICRVYHEVVNDDEWEEMKLRIKD